MSSSIEISFLKSQRSFNKGDYLKDALAKYLARMLLGDGRCSASRSTPTRP